MGTGYINTNSVLRSRIENLEDSMLPNKFELSLQLNYPVAGKKKLTKDFKKNFFARAYNK